MGIAMFRRYFIQIMLVVTMVAAAGLSISILINTAVVLFGGMSHGNSGSFGLAATLNSFLNISLLVYLAWLSYQIALKNKESLCI